MIDPAKVIPYCEYEHSDCFALLCDGTCACLSDTDFRYSKDCPFYKTDDDVAPYVVHEIRKLNIRKRKNYEMRRERYELRGYLQS